MTATRNPLSRLAILAALAVGHAHASLFHVTVDTTALGNAPAVLAFDLTSDGSTPNSVAISGFNSIGGLLGNAYQFDGITYVSAPALSTPATTVILTNPFLFNEYVQYITLGSSFEFDFEPSANLPSNPSFPDTFSFYILVPASEPPPDPPDLLPSLVLSTSPDGAALFSYEIGVTDPAQPEVYLVTTNPDGGQPQRIPVDVISASVPEPGALALAMVSLLRAGCRAFGKDSPVAVESVRVAGMYHPRSTRRTRSGTLRASWKLQGWAV